MNSTLIKSVIASLLLCAITESNSQEQTTQELKIATGTQTGTYSTMFKELYSRCSNLHLKEVATDGSNTNIDMILHNQANAGFVQTDVLFYRGANDNIDNIKTLFTLYQEEVHIIALAHSLKKEGGLLGVGGEYRVYTQLNDLNGKKVGAAGGGFITAQVIKAQTDLKFDIIQYDSPDRVISAIKSGEIDAGVIVGGQPIPLISNLGPEYRLIAIPPATQAKLKSVYKTTKLSYTKMMASVQSVATDSIVVTRVYGSIKVNNDLNNLRKCLVDNVSELKDTLGTHPKWQIVDPSNKGKWPYYELPTRNITNK